MGFTDLFKKTNYFDPKMNPSCSYCQFGKRSSEGGGRIFCEKKGMVDENSSCNKFVYSPLKRIPVKQLEQEGALSDDEMYVEVDDSKPTAAEKEKEEAEAAAKAQAEAEAAAKAQAEAEAAAKAQAEAEAAAKAQAEAEAAANMEAQAVQNTLDDIDAVLAEFDAMDQNT